MEEIKFRSKDGIIYIGEIKDIIEINKKQKAKIKDLASKKTAFEIEDKGIELSLEKWQEEAVIKKIREITGYNKDDKQNILSLIKNIINKRIVRFSSHAEYERMPDPSRHCTTKEAVIKRLIYTGKVRKFKANIQRKSKKIEPQFCYTTESELDGGKLAISFIEDKHILIITVLS